MVKYVKASRMFDLPAEGTGRQSFYGKAKIVEDGNTATLYSYNTPVARIVDGVFEELEYTPHSQTTNRHIKQFKKFYDIEASTDSSDKYVKASNEYHTETVNGHEIEYYNEVPEVAYECADIIADEIEKADIMNFTEIEKRIHEISGLDYDTIFDIELDKYVYELLHFRGIDQNYSDGDFFTIEYGDAHPELRDE